VASGDSGWPRRASLSGLMIAARRDGLSRARSLRADRVRVRQRLRLTRGALPAQRRRRTQLDPPVPAGAAAEPRDRPGRPPAHRGARRGARLRLPRRRLSMAAAVGSRRPGHMDTGSRPGRDRPRGDRATARTAQRHLGRGRDLDGPPAAVEGVDDELLAARHDSVVLSSTDGGRTWRPLLER
jgi:hypothetical protein